MGALRWTTEIVAQNFSVRQEPRRMCENVLDLERARVQWRERPPPGVADLLVDRGDVELG